MAKSDGQVNNVDLIKEEFKVFFKACNKEKEPYQWQIRFLEYIVNHKGKWPEAIDAPTSAGKTVAVEIHLFVNYLAAIGKISSSTPRRMIASVNRRAVIDKQYEKALKIQKAMAEALREDEKSGKNNGRILYKVADALRKRANETEDEVESGKPFDVARIRGGLGKGGIDRSWRVHPTRVSIICMTPAMFGSRLLFRGYGTSTRMRPVEAGLLAYDSVLFLDEAHLNNQLNMTAKQISRIDKLCQGEESAAALKTAAVMPLQVCAASATLNDNSNSVIRVDENDLKQDKELANRLNCPKLVKIVKEPENKKTWDGELLYQAEKMYDMVHNTFPGPVACIFNSPKKACDFHKKLVKHQKEKYKTEDEKKAVENNVRCIVGKMRHYEGDEFRKILCEPDKFKKLDFVVATQTIELGIDVSFPCMLTELASIPALSQRAGRTNREGNWDLSDKATKETPLIYVWENQETKNSNVYRKKQLEFARQWVNERAKVKEGLSAWACFNWKEDFKDDQGKIDQVKINNIQEAEMRGRKCFERLEFADAEYFSRTSENLACETRNVLTGKASDLKLWLEDSFESSAEVNFVVRKWPKYNGESGESDIDDNDMQSLLEELKPLDNEMVPCHIATARKIVSHLCELAKDKQHYAPFLISNNGNKPKKFALEAQEGCVSVNALVPGNVIVVSESAEIFLSEIAYCNESEKCKDPFKGNEHKESIYCTVTEQQNSKNPESCVAVPFLFEPNDTTPEGMEDVFGCVNDYINNKKAAFAKNFIKSVKALKSNEGNQQLRALLKAFEIDNGHGRCELVYCPGHAEQGFCVVYKPNWRFVSGKNDKKGEVEPPSLEQHEADVKERVFSMAETLKLPDLKDALTEAAANHDEGKRAAKFQDYLKDDETYNKYKDFVIAKGLTENLSAKERKGKRSEALLPLNWRHEQYSALKYWQSCTNPKGESSGESVLDKELITRLIGTSHGCGRAMFDHNSKALLEADDDAIQQQQNLLDCANELFDQGLWDAIVENTNIKYGFWFVSYLEAILRAADGQVSSEGK